MSRDDSGGAGAVLMAFVLGAVAGAAVALLWAPTSGEETRRLLGEKAKEGKEKAAEAAQKGREFVAKQRETITTAIEKGREAYHRAHEKDNA